MTFPRVFEGLARVAAALGACTVLASCGGGDQVERFVPERIVVFGDESVALAAGGDKYGVNALATGSTTVRDCTAYPVWPQVLAGAHGFVFTECNPNGVTPRARMYASATQNNAAGVEAQVSSFLAPGSDGPFGAKDLVVVAAGTNDIVAALSATDPTAAVNQAATVLAGQINRIINTGAKVVFASVPNPGWGPWGRADATRAAQLTALTTAFNSTLRSTVLNDGRRVALVDAYESVRQVVLNPVLQGFANTTDAVCANVSLTAVSLPVTTCTNAATDLVPNGNPATWLWSDNLRLGPAAQGRIGVLAADRVRNHPF